MRGGKPRVRAAAPGRPGMPGLEIGFWLLVAASAWLFPYHLPLITHSLIFGLFAVSLDVVLGYAGILTVGHAAFFGMGAYTAGLLAAHGWGEPLSGLVLAALVCAVPAYLLAFLVVRGADLTRLMITVAVALLLTEAARQFSAVTGGTDGLQGIMMWPVLGLFSFDLYGRTAFVYTFVVVLAAFLVVRATLASAFGLSLQGIRQNPERMAAIGAPLGRRLRTAYIFSAALAGIAGALLAQTTQFVSVDALSFERSAEVLIILVLGGAGHLYGGLAGAFVYMLLRDALADISPQYWMLGVGLALILIALGGRGGLLGMAGRLYARLRP